MLVIKGRIPRSEFKDDLFQKLNLRVQELLLGVVFDLTYKQLCVRALNIDNKVRINQKLAIAKRATKAPFATSQIQGQIQKTYVLNLGILPL